LASQFSLQFVGGVPRHHYIMDKSGGRGGR
jgi:hypothetical protein